MSAIRDDNGENGFPFKRAFGENHLAQGTRYTAVCPNTMAIARTRFRIGNIKPNRVESNRRNYHGEVVYVGKCLLTGAGGEYDGYTFIRKKCIKNAIGPGTPRQSGSVSRDSFNDG